MKKNGKFYDNIPEAIGETSSNYIDVIGPYPIAWL